MALSKDLRGHSHFTSSTELSFFGKGLAKNHVLQKNVLPYKQDKPTPVSARYWILAQIKHNYNYEERLTWSKHKDTYTGLTALVSNTSLEDKSENLK